MAKKSVLFFCMPGLVVMLIGCFQMMAEEREPLPVIVWPKAPEVARINFINSISRPEDVGIKSGAIRQFLNLFKGEDERVIVKPYGIETDTEDRYYVVDNLNKFIHVFDAKNKIYDTFPDREVSLQSPIDIAIDTRGTIYVSDSREGVVFIFEKNGQEYIGEMGRGTLKRPTGLAVNNKTDELLVVDTLDSRIIRFDLHSREMKGGIGQRGGAEGMFHYPTNIFVSGDGRIYVSDSLNFRIQIFSPEGQFLHAFGEVGNNPGFFARPRGVAVDSDGNIYVVDALFDTVQMFNKEGRLLMDFGGPGHRYGEFWLPSGIHIDSRDRVYVSDTYNKRIQIFEYIKEVE